MRHIKFWIAALLISAVFLSCSTTHRAVSIQQTHTDSTRVVTDAFKASLRVDSTVKLSSDSSWSKVTVIEYGVDTIKTDSLPIFKPYIKSVTIKETGRVDKTDTASKAEVSNTANKFKDSSHVVASSKSKTVLTTRTGIPGYWYIILIAILAFVIWRVLKYLNIKI